MLKETVMRFTFFDMPVKVMRSAQIGTGILIVICTALAIFLTPVTPLDAFFAGLLATLIYWFGDLMHQYGHFLAAKQTGKPSTGLTLWWILGTTRYPRNEGQLSPYIHMRRAIGGPLMSLVMLIIFLFFGSFLWNYSPLARFLVGWGIFVNGIVLTVGALFPFAVGDFATDGMTLWRAWRDLQHA